MAARRAPKPGEAGGQAAAAEKVAELLLDEAWQPFPVTQTGGLRAEGFEMIADHLIQHALRGIPRLILRGRRRHALSSAARVPCGESSGIKGFQRTRRTNRSAES